MQDKMRYPGQIQELDSPINVYPKLLDCERVRARHSFELLANAKITNQDFYSYQITGAVSRALKTHGRMNQKYTCSYKVLG